MGSPIYANSNSELTQYNDQVQKLPKHADDFYGHSVKGEKAPIIVFPKQQVVVKPQNQKSLLGKLIKDNEPKG